VQHTSPMILWRMIIGRLIQFNVDIEDIKKLKYNLIYAHPESLLCRQGQLLIKSIKAHVCALAIDETHMVLE
jgi:superfamily II DNA helicase RecQ